MNIVYSSSYSYFKPTFVSIYSLLINSRQKHRIIILANDIPDSCCASLRKMVSGLGSTILIEDVSDKLSKLACEYGLKPLRGSFSTYSRIFLSELLPNLEEVLLIDSDTLVVGDVACLLPVTTECCFAASRDYVVSNIYSKHEEVSLRRVTYFNAGVLYVNLARFRSCNLLSRLEDLKTSSWNPKIADQSILNRYYPTHFSELSIKFNFYTYFHYGFGYEFYRKLNNSTSFLTTESFAEAEQSPVILHFVGSWFERPWFKLNISAYDEEYRRYWDCCFASRERELLPGQSLLKYCYDLLSIFIYYTFGSKAYFYFRYYVIQKFKIILNKGDQ